MNPSAAARCSQTLPFPGRGLCGGEGLVVVGVRALVARAGDVRGAVGVVSHGRLLLRMTVPE